MATDEYIDNDSDFIKSTDKNPSNILPEKLTFDSKLAVCMSSQGQLLHRLLP